MLNVYCLPSSQAPLDRGPKQEKWGLKTKTKT